MMKGSVCLQFRLEGGARGSRKAMAGTEEYYHDHLVYPISMSATSVIPT